MRRIDYSFTYNKIKFLNTLVMELVFTERQFNNEVDKILEQVKLPSSAINNIEEYSIMQIDTGDLHIETRFDKYTIVDAARFMIAKLLSELCIKVKYNLDLRDYLEYDDSDVEPVYNYPVIHIMPSYHKEFTFSTYPIYHTLDCTDKIAYVIIEHLIKDSVLVNKGPEQLELSDQSESILIKSSMYDKKITIGFVSKNDIKMSLRSKIALILDICVFNSDTSNSSDE